MRKLTKTLATLTAALAFGATAHAAGNPEGKIQVKVLATAVLPSGAVTKVNNGVLPVGANAVASDNVAPTVAVEYFLKPNVSVETICCLTQHHVNGAGALAGANLVNHVLILPATVTVKYHLPLPGFKPYIGAGPALFFIIDERVGATLAGAADQVKMSNEFGIALQAGVDVPLSNGFGLSLDAKKYFVSTNAHFSNAGVEVLSTRHKLDPWVLSAGVAYRF